MLKKIIFWGATGQAKVLEEFLEECGYQLIAVFDNNRKTRSPFKSVPIYYGEQGFMNWIKAKKKSSEELFFAIAIGGNEGEARAKIGKFLMKNGLMPATLIHPSAYVAKNALIGAGSQILAHATICAQATVGKFCIVNTSASVDHDCELADGVHIAPGAKLAGEVSVGKNCLIGVGAVILPRLKVNAHSIVGGGAVVTKNVSSNQVVCGNPARVLRKMSKG